MDEMMVSQIAGQLAIMVLTGVASWMGGKFKGMHKERELQQQKSERERDQTRAMLRLLIYYQLKNLFSKYVVEGAQIASSDKHEIEEIYTYYHDTLGGNGEGTRMYKELMALKTT